MRHKRISGIEVAKLYWSARAGSPAGEVHLSVSEAYRTRKTMCEEAWNAVIAKEQVVGPCEDRGAEFLENLESMLADIRYAKKLAKHEKAMLVNRRKPY